MPKIVFNDLALRIPETRFATAQWMVLYHKTDETFVWMLECVIWSFMTGMAQKGYQPWEIENDVALKLLYWRWLQITAGTAEADAYLSYLEWVECWERCSLFK